MFYISERILLTLWVGSMWSVGYLVAPTLFSMLDDRALAGRLAGQMFTIVSYIGLLGSIMLLFGQFFLSGRKTWRIWCLLIMLVILILGEFVLQPMMAELKKQGLSQGSDSARHFARLHGVASVLYLINSLLGLVLVIFGLHGREGSELRSSAV